MNRSDNGITIKMAHLLDGVPRWVFLLFIAVLGGVALYCLFLPQPSMLDDNFHYMNLAKNLYNGKGYTSPYSAEPIPETHVAPGYPLMLAGIMKIMGNPEPLIALKIFNNICYLNLIHHFHL